MCCVGRLGNLVLNNCIFCDNGIPLILTYWNNPKQPLVYSQTKKFVCERCKLGMFPSSLTYNILCRVGWAGASLAGKAIMTVPSKSMDCCWVPWSSGWGPDPAHWYLPVWLRALLCHEIGAAGSPSMCGKGSPSFQCLDSETAPPWKPGCPTTWFITYYGKGQGNCPPCWASEREKRISYLWTPEGSRSLKNVDVGITLGFWGEHLPSRLSWTKEKSDVKAAAGHWDLLFTLQLLRFRILVAPAHSTQFLFPNKLNRKLIFKETSIFRFPLLGNILASLQPNCDTVRNSSHVFSSKNFPSGLS